MKLCKIVTLYSGPLLEFISDLQLGQLPDTCPCRVLFILRVTKT